MSVLVVQRTPFAFSTS